jgi:hypothetical protein
MAAQDCSSCIGTVMLNTEKELLLDYTEVVDEKNYVRPS